MKTERQRGESAVILSEDSLLSILKKPIALYRGILRQAGYSNKGIAAIERAASRKGYKSGFFDAASSRLPLPERELIAVKHLISQIACFRAAVKSHDEEKVIEAVDDIFMAQESLFNVNSRLRETRKGSRKAVTVKDDVKKDILQDARRIHADYFAREDASPKPMHLFDLVMTERRNRGDTTRERAWFYDLLKKYPIR